MRLLVLAGLLGLVLAQTRSSNKKVVVENGAICENKASAFFVIDNTMLTAEDNVIYKEFSEEECMNTCSNNRDPFGRSVLCSAFVYDHVSFTCTVYKDKSKPEGTGDSSGAVGKRYFEKFCLSEDLPIGCADAQFIRADDSVLVGYASNVTLADTLEECVATCVKDTTCKSAMFFYEEGECITNTESALTRPNSFAKEDTEKVIYFQNGCLAKQLAMSVKKNKDSKNPPVSPVKNTKETSSSSVKDEEDATDYDTTPEGSGMASEGEDNIESGESGEIPPSSSNSTTSDTSLVDEVAGNLYVNEKPYSAKATTTLYELATSDSPVLRSQDNTKSSAEVTITNPSVAATNKDDESVESTTTISRKRKFEESDSISSDEEEEEFGEIEEEATTSAIPPKRKTTKSNAQYIKYKSHPRNFGAKTMNPANKEKMVKKQHKEQIEEDSEIQPASVSPASQEEENNDDLSQEEMKTEEFLGNGELPQGQEGVSKKHNIAIKPLKIKEEQFVAQNYFSDWSDWTPCTKSGERRIRRRKCLDLRKCLGALMQVENCPAITTTIAPVDDYDLPPLESVSSIISAPTDIDRFADQNAGPVQLPAVSADPASVPAHVLPEGSPTDTLVWSPWLGVCQQFASGQPCNNGEMIGFESRECIAKEPIHCDGPFFRYCTLSC